jgi:hypothetical protein
MQKEYNKWKMMQNILRKVSPAFYDLYNHPPGILEIWIINMISDNGIEIFESGDLDYKHLESQLQHTGKKNQIEDYKKIINFMTQNYRAMEVDNIYEPRYTEINDITTFYYGKFNKSIESDRAKVLLKTGSLEQIIIMMMRYAFISIRGSHQWSCPQILYSNLIKYYDIQIEGFGSPLNSQMMMLKFYSLSNSFPQSFCSLFPDTDKIFGSLGNFFKQDFRGKRVFINPPFIPSMIIKIHQMLENFLNENEKGLYIIDIPEWPEENCYKNLMSSKFLKYHHTFEKGEHYYMHGEKKINPTFKSTFFLLSGLDVKNDLNKLYNNYSVHGKMEKGGVKFFTWNILTRSYFNYESYKDANPADFNLKKRDAFILNKLADLMDQRYIISLQEVDLTVWNKLCTLFDNYNYNVNWSHAGNISNDYMGVLLAWPRDEYKLLEFKQCMPATLAKEDEPKDFVPNSPWSVVAKKWNWLLMAKLEKISSKKKMICAAYHAPLFPNNPDATFIANDLLFYSLEKFSEDLPVIIGGDFNIPPSSESFKHVIRDSKKKQRNYFRSKIIYLPHKERVSL